MNAPSPCLLRALRIASASPFSPSTSFSATTSTTRLTSRCPQSQFQPQSLSRQHLSTSPALHRAHPALVNKPSATSIGAPRTPGLAPRSRDRGPTSKEDTQTDFGSLNVLANTPPPATAIDACLDDGFHLSNGVKITGGAGVLLVGGEAFAWRPWEELAGTKGDQEARRAMVNQKYQLELPQRAWGLLDLVWPKPELLIVGVGAGMFPLSKETKSSLNDLGVRVDVLDTRNAAAQFNLLATERGVGVVAAAMLPLGFKVI